MPFIVTNDKKCVTKIRKLLFIDEINCIQYICVCVSYIYVCTKFLLKNILKNKKDNIENIILFAPIF